VSTVSINKSFGITVLVGNAAELHDAMPKFVGGPERRSTDEMIG